MDHQGPSGGHGRENTPPGKDQQQNVARNAQPIIDLFGVDLGTAVFISILLMLGMMRAAMTRCVCL